MSSRIFNIKKFVIISIFIAGICTILNSSQVFAKISEADLVKKAANGGLYNCYYGYLPSWQIIGEGNGATFNNVSNLSINNDNQVVVLPSGTASRDSLSCKEFYKGAAGFNGLFKMGYGVGEPGSSNAAKADFLQKVGYEPDGEATAKRECIALKYSVIAMNGGKIVSGPHEYTSNFICASLDDNGNIDSSTSIENDGRGNGTYITMTVTGTDVIIATPESNTSIPFVIGESWQGFKDRLKSQTADGSGFIVGNPDPNGSYTSYKYIGYNEDPGSGGNSYVYKYAVKNLANTYSTATNNIFGGDNREFNKTDTISLYQYYLNKYTEDRACSDKRETVDALVANGYNPKKVRLIKGGKYYDNCYIKNNNSSMFSAVSGGQLRAGDINVDGIIEYLNSHTPEWIGDVLDADIHFPSEEDPENSDNPVTAPGESTEDSEENDDVCYGSEGTLGLSWILCPITQMLYDALDGIYETVEKNFLELKPELLGEKTHNAWDTFQNVANIAFIILLLVVIFSQLTGVGIDNYGIKKILPRLVICAILVNLSFFITQLLFDASNIIGVSIRSLFDGLSTSGDQATGGAIAGEVIGGGLITGAAGITIAAFVTNPALLLSLLLGLITGVFSVLVLLAILIAREVGVVIAVIIAPLAFVSYMLPNTSKWLKSWGNLVKGLLLLYPLAAGVVGASAFVGGIVGNIDKGNEWLSLAAMLVRVVPFFFLPTLFRRSISAMGNLGATIQGLGRGASRGLNRRISSSEGYRNLQKTGLERQNRIRAGLDREGKLTRRGEIRARVAKLGSGIGLDKLQASRIARANKAREEGISSTAELGEAIERRELARNSGQNRQDYLENQLREALSSGSTSDYFAAVDQATKSGMKSSDIAKITRRVFDGGYWGGALTDSGERGNFLQEFANRYGGSFLKKDAEQKSWAATRGGLDVDSTAHPNARGALTGFASRGGMETADLKDNEIIDLSADRLHELLRDGIIDQAQAQRVWSSGANMDSINKLMLGAMGTRGELINKGDAQAMTSNTYAGGLHGLDRQAVQALTEATPQDTVIRDVRWKNENGETRQTDPLWTTQDPNVNQQITFTKDLGNGGSQNLNLIQQWDGSFRDPKTGKVFKEETLRKGGYRRR